MVEVYNQGGHLREATMKSEAYQWRHNQPITDDYIHRFDRVQELFEYHPWEAHSLELRAAWLDSAQHARAQRSGLIAALKEFNLQAGNTYEAMQAIESLEREETLCVIGGQQAGLFSGPLLVIYKAITIIQQAREAAKRLNRPVVPIFWIAGEDHDWDEVNHVFVAGSNMEIDKIKLNRSSEARSPVSQIKIAEDDWKQAIKQLDDVLMETEFKEELINKLEHFTIDSSTLVDFFAKMMAWLFGRYGLILMDSADPNIRQLEGVMFAQLITKHEEINRAILSKQQKLINMGYTPQAPAQEGQANLFILDKGERRLLQAHPDGFVDRKDELKLTVEQCLQIAQQTPDQLSNNVMTRPLMQEFLFPVLGTVLGPGEIAYWGQTAEAFRVLSMKMPLIFPRQEFTLIEGTIQKHMSKYNLTFEDVALHFEEKRNEWLKTQDHLKLDDKFTAVKEQFEQLYEPLLQTVAQINEGISKLGQTNKQKIIEQIEFLEQRATQAFEAQYEASLRHLDRIQLSLLPLDKPQERVYNIFVYLNKHGTGWLEEIMDSEPPSPMHHTIKYF